jgi:predicted transport protein
VVDLIKALGYDLSKENEVDIEYDVPIGTGGKGNKKLDYAIKNGENKFALEIKSPKEEIEGNEGFYRQIYSYYRLLHYRYGVLYNGRKLIVFKDSYNGSNKIVPAYVWDFDKNFPDITIFESLSNNNFPSALEDFLSSGEKLTNLQKYIEDNEDTLLDYLTSKISEDSKINNLDFVRTHTDIKIDYKSNITYTFDRKVKDEVNNVDESEDFHVLRASENIKKLYFKLKNMIIDINPDVTVTHRKHYTNFNRKSIFASLGCGKTELKLWLHLKIDQLNDPKKIGRDVSNLGHWSSGSSEITLKEQNDLDYAIDLIKQSYNKTE